MQIVLRFAKRGKDDQEYVREKVVTFKRQGAAHFNWNEAVAAAIFHAQSGERIVAIIEGGYQ